MIHSPKDKSLEWKSVILPRPKKVRLFKSRVKVMFIAFFDVRGVVHIGFCHKAKQSINTTTKAFYNI